MHNKSILVAFKSRDALHSLCLLRLQRRRFRIGRNFFFSSPRSYLISFLAPKKSPYMYPIDEIWSSSALHRILMKKLADNMIFLPKRGGNGKIKIKLKSWISLRLNQKKLFISQFYWFIANLKKYWSRKKECGCLNKIIRGQVPQSHLHHSVHLTDMLTRFSGKLAGYCKQACYSC